MSNEQVEREGLASIVSDALAELLGQQPGGPVSEDYKVADAILAAGFHLTPTPQVVETVAELEALAHIEGAIILDANNECYRLIVTVNMLGETTRHDWESLSKFYFEPAFPATVLYPHPTPDVGVIAEEKRLAGLLESGVVVDDLLAYGKGDGMVYAPAGLLRAAIELIGDAWEEGLAASGVAQAFAPDQLVNPYREAGR